MAVEPSTSIPESSRARVRFKYFFFITFLPFVQDFARLFYSGKEEKSPKVSKLNP
jgi:hypothetical protein